MVRLRAHDRLQLHHLPPRVRRGIAGGGWRALQDRVQFPIELIEMAVEVAEYMPDRVELGKVAKCQAIHASLCQAVLLRSRDPRGVLPPVDILVRRGSVARGAARQHVTHGARPEHVDAHELRDTAVVGKRLLGGDLRREHLGQLVHPRSLARPAPAAGRQRPTCRRLCLPCRQARWLAPWTGIRAARKAGCRTRGCLVRDASCGGPLRLSNDRRAGDTCHARFCGAVVGGHGARQFPPPSRRPGKRRNRFAPS